VIDVVLVVTAIALFQCGVAPAADDPPPGVIRFRGHTAIGSSDGEFRRWHITDAVIDEEHPERSSVAVVIDLTSLDTGNATRDRHLRGADFFDVGRYPTATLRVSDVEVEDAQHFMASVYLNLHGQSKTFPMDFVIVDRASRRITGQISLKRSDFGVGATGSVFNPLHVDDEVQVMIEATAPVSGDVTAAVPSRVGRARPLSPNAARPRRHRGHSFLASAALIRGGNFGSLAGVFALSAGRVPSDFESFIGFRCAR
jgi:polyisoprenoid-binding protein YceI